jgi:hypothetical protein
MRNLHSLSLKITLEASTYDIPQQGAGGSSRHMKWEPLVLAYHNRELVVLAELWMKVTFCVEPLKGVEAI